MAEGSNNLTTYYAKRIIGDNAAASPDKALLQTGTAITSDEWILNQTARYNESPSKKYGILYNYDNDGYGHDVIEFWGNKLDTNNNNNPIPSVSITLDSGNTEIMGTLDVVESTLLQSTLTVNNTSLFKNTVTIQMTSPTLILDSTASGAVDWTIKNNQGIFTINNSGSGSGTQILGNSTKGWEIDERLYINASILDSSNYTLYVGGKTYVSGVSYLNGQVGIGYNPETSGNSYKLYVNGTSYLNGNTEVNGRVWIQAGSVAGSNVNRLETTAGMPGDMQYNQSRRGTQIYTNGIAFADPYNGNSNNDAGWIRQIETTASSGYLEIATGDDGSEPIYVRQYKTDNTIARTFTLLDGSGNSSIPGHVDMPNETSIKFKIARKKANGGGWAYNPIQIRGDDDTIFSRWGVYGSGNDLSYIFFGVGDYNTTTHIRIDSSGHLVIPNDGIYYQGTKEKYRMIRFIDNTADIYGNGISIGGGGLAIFGSGESADTMVSNLGYTGGSEVTVIASDGSILFYPGNNSYDASAKLEMAASRFWAGVNGNTAREAQVGCQSGAGQIYLWSHAATSGSRGLYVPAHGSGGAKAVINVDTNNVVTFNGDLSGNAATATCVIHPDASVSYIAGAKGSSAAVYAKKTYNADHWYPAVTLETKGGGAWQIGNYNDDTLEFQYATKANRDNNNNSTSEIYMTNGDTGRVITTGNRDNWTFLPRGHTHSVSELTWGAGVNLTCTGNNSEWSIDMNGTGSYWHVWSSTQSASCIRCYNADAHVEIPRAIDVGLNKSGSLIIGNPSGLNLAFDDNEMMARNNGAASTFYINSEGGLVYIGSGGLQVNGTITGAHTNINGTKRELQIRYGSQNVSYGTTTTINFSPAFSNACLMVVPLCAQLGFGAYDCISMNNYSKSSFQVYNYNSSHVTMTVGYIAIGY